MDFLLDDATGDIALTDNEIQYVPTEEQLTKQRVLIALGVYKGEWLFNINYGTPWLANDNNPLQLLGKTTKEFIDVYLKDIITDVDGIVSIVSFNSTLDKRTRVYSLTFKAITTTGEIVSISTTI